MASSWLHSSLVLAVLDFSVAFMVFVQRCWSDCHKIQTLITHNGLKVCISVLILKYLFSMFQCCINCDQGAFNSWWRVKWVLHVLHVYDYISLKDLTWNYSMSTGCIFTGSKRTDMCSWTDFFDWDLDWDFYFTQKSPLLLFWNVIF